MDQHEAQIVETNLYQDKINNYQSDNLMFIGRFKNFLDYAIEFA